MQAQRRYLSNRIETASPGEIVVMLYDGAIRSIGRAADGVRSGDFAAAAEANAKAMEIIAGLAGCVDTSVDDPLVGALLAHYTSWSRRLLRALANADPDGYDRVGDEMLTLREAWAEIKHTRPASRPRAVS